VFPAVSQKVLLTAKLKIMYMGDASFEIRPIQRLTERKVFVTALILSRIIPRLFY
jgi:hypothetical protein